MPLPSRLKFVFSDPDAADCQLTLVGTYTIRVNKQLDIGTIDYGLALERIVPLSAAAQPIASGQTRADEINAVGDLDAYFFSGNANDLYLVQIARQSGGTPVFEVREREKRRCLYRRDRDLGDVPEISNMFS